MARLLVIVGTPIARCPGMKALGDQLGGVGSTKTGWRWSPGQSAGPRGNPSEQSTWRNNSTPPSPERGCRRRRPRLFANRRLERAAAALYSVSKRKRAARF
ncbi:MAG TPA: hypothetical protein VLH09_05490, partial [Bryobacteraceae bacterium]|nr:hypothetical protein [Bryobacteraceae bacterium]